MADMEFGLLGPLVVRKGGVLLPVPRGHQRTVLAVLLLEAGRAVTVDQIVEAVWGAGPPSAGVTVRNLIRRLRQTLGDAGKSRITAQARGYLIRADADELDLARFEALAGAAREAVRGGCWEEAAMQARAALGLWRGEPLAGVESETLAVREVPRLAEMRWQVLETRIDADLHLGRHRELVAELRRLAATHPLREQVHALLMLALYRCGRQGEALAAYQHARTVLAAELGTEPGAGLRRVHQQILTADPAVAAPEPARSSTTVRPGAWPVTSVVAAGHSAAVVPRQLPAAVAGFTGRTAELAALDGLLDQAGAGAPGTVVISAIGGTAGVGKTALAVQWAHRVAARFPDGQLYMNLRGFGPSGSLMDPAAVICAFLDAFGVPAGVVPAQAEAQAGLYRSLLADRRMLIVLDNARDEAQVRPLLPAGPASLVLVTSRNQLSGLSVADGARLVSLDLLAHDEAVQLLSARIGAARTAAEPGVASEIAALCAHLPLALAVAAARAAARPRFALAQLAAELRGAAGRLEALDAGDPAVSVRVVFSWSYQQLSPAAARMFRLLGLHPGPDISIPAAASLAGIEQAEARRLLRELDRDCLITEHAPGRYAFHDLLRAYAASQARDCDSQPDRDAAIGRLLDHYLHTADHSSMLLRPGSQLVSLAAPCPGASPERLADHRQALAWFDAERQVLLAAVTLAAETGADRHAWQLPCVMTEYLRRRGYLHERVTILSTALAAATRLDDTLGQAISLRRLGIACTDTGDYDQGIAHLERCLPLHQRLGDRVGEAWTQVSLSRLAEAQGRYADALRHNKQALRVFQAIGDEAAEAEMVGYVGWCHALLGDYQRAREYCAQSMDLIAKLGHCAFECTVWDTLGYIEHQLGDFARAGEHFESALNLCRDLGDRRLEAEILIHVGDARHAAGELPQARDAWQQALAIYDDIHHPHTEQVRAKLAGTDS